MDGEGRPYITLGFIKAMMEEFRQERLIHKRYAFQVRQAKSRGWWGSEGGAVGNFGDELLACSKLGVRGFVSRQCSTQ